MMIDKAASELKVLIRHNKELYNGLSETCRKMFNSRKLDDRNDRMTEKRRK